MVEITVPPELIEELDQSFYHGPMLNENGIRNLNEEFVDHINKMSVVIKADEHAPPHFHVKYAGEDARFSIADGRRLPKIKGLEKYEYSIREWWENHYCKLIEVWNRTRPTDCPVGPVVVPPECLPSEADAVAKS